MMGAARRFLLMLVCVAGLWGCSSTKHVPEGEYLLDKVDISVKDGDKIQTEELYNFLRQQPNHKVLGFAKLQLSMYSLSGRDSTKWYNRWLRRIGQAPVIYDHELTEASARQLKQALVNRGYMDARVVADTVSRKGKKMEVEYGIFAGTPHYIGSMAYNIPDTAVRRVVLRDTAATDAHVGVGDLFDRNRLDEERGRIVDLLRNAGYYEINRDCITYTADTVSGSRKIGLTLNLRASAVHAPATAVVVAPGDTTQLFRNRRKGIYRCRRQYHVGGGLAGRREARHGGGA